MKVRVIGIVVALVLGIVGTVVLVAYVRSARDDAVADEEMVPVYVVTDVVPAGTPVDVLVDRIEAADIPKRLVAPDAVSDLSVLVSDYVAAVELRPGEQLLTSRLTSERGLTRIDVPAGLQELTVALDAERALGGALEPGNTVGVLISFEPFDVSEAGMPVSEGVDPPPPAAVEGEVTTTTTVPSRTPNTTHLVFHQVLVTAVQYSQSDADLVVEQDDQISDEVGVGPTNKVYVTLAVTGAQAEQVVFGAEFGTLWLTAENERAETGGTRIVTLNEAYDEGATR